MMGSENLAKSRARGQRVGPADTRACPALGAHFNHLAALPLQLTGADWAMLRSKDGCEDKQLLHRGSLAEHTGDGRGLLNNS